MLTGEQGSADYIGAPLLLFLITSICTVKISFTAPEKVTHGMEVSPETAEKIMLRIMGATWNFQ